MVDHGVAPSSQGKQRPKRVITEARKAQNREAQRAYRQRLKERREMQQQQAAAAVVSKTVRPLRPVLIDNNEPSEQPVEANLRGGGPGQPNFPLPVPPESGVRAADQQPSLGVLTPESSSGGQPQQPLAYDDLLTQLELEDLDVVNVPTSSHSSTGNTAMPDLQGMHSLLVGNLRPPSPGSQVENPNSSDIPVSNLAQQSTGPPTPASNTTLFLADLYQNTLQPPRASLFKACLFNARHLGITVDEFYSYNCLSLCSPFYRPVSPSDDPKALVAAASHPSIPTHLQPTLPQILFPHHPLFDFIPIPALRARAIMLAATLPALIDLMDLKLDIVEGGLVCGRTNRRGSGQPWDSWSWEAAPWFREKWRLVVNGEGVGLGF